jgi:hypothetical protein
MSARPFDLPATFARIWVDSSIHMLSATTDFWAGLMSTAPKLARTSTASPWWMPPQHLQMTGLAQASSWPAAFASGAWAPTWPGVMPLTNLVTPPTNALFPWLPTARTAPASNPFALWQQMWLRAAAPSAAAPWLPPSETPATDALWQPVTSAYRTANGHAMAAVLRTMADVVEPKPAAFNPAHYWPTTLGTRH